MNRKLIKATKAYKIYYDGLSKTFQLEMLTTFFLDKNLTDSLNIDELPNFIKAQTPLDAYRILYENAFEDLTECIKTFKGDSEVDKAKEYINTIYDDGDDYVAIEPKKEETHKIGDYVVDYSEPKMSDWQKPVPEMEELINNSVPVQKPIEEVFTSLEDIEKLYMEQTT